MVETNNLGISGTIEKDNGASSLFRCFQNLFPLDAKRYLRSFQCGVDRLPSDSLPTGTFVWATSRSWNEFIPCWRMAMDNVDRYCQWLKHSGKRLFRLVNRRFPEICLNMLHVWFNLIDMFAAKDSNIGGQHALLWSFDENFNKPAGLFGSGNFFQKNTSYVTPLQHFKLQWASASRCFLIFYAAEVFSRTPGFLVIVLSSISALEDVEEILTAQGDVSHYKFVSRDLLYCYTARAWVKPG